MNDKHKDSPNDETPIDLPASGEAGYGKPPKATQFSKGKSGNPKGRPKNSKNLKTVLNAELNGLVQIKIGGKIIKVSKRQAMMIALTNKAIHGDSKAANALVNLDIQFNAPETEPDGEMPTREEDRKIIQNHAIWNSKFKDGK